MVLIAALLCTLIRGATQQELKVRAPTAPTALHVMLLLCTQCQQSKAS